jgi:dienelactone hydrolase
LIACRLADSFGRAGYLTIAPDMFNGTPAPADLNDPAYNLTDFLYRHRPEIIDPILDSVISFITQQLGVDKVVTAGYCFGGRHSFRLLSEGRGVSASFTAHPSLLEDAEITAITGPVSVAAAGQLQRKVKFQTLRAFVLTMCLSRA